MRRRGAILRQGGGVGSYGGGKWRSAQWLNGGWSRLRETAEGNLAAPWESIELETVRVLEAMKELRESPDYELQRLTERSPEFFDETVGLHLESLETELATLQSEAETLAGEIEELTGEKAGFAQAGSGMTDMQS